MTWKYYFLNGFPALKNTKNLALPEETDGRN